MVSRDKEVQVNISALEKQQRVRLFQTYLELRTRRLDYRQWLSESRKILKTLKDAGCDYPDYQMYEAFFCAIKMRRFCRLRKFKAVMRINLSPKRI